jgi:hypothetical protein
MTKSLSGYKFQVLPKLEVSRLFRERHMEQKISQCKIEERLEDQGEYHHTFCCKIIVRYYLEPETDVEVAVISTQTFVDPGKEPEICVVRFCDQREVFSAAVPS